MVSIEWRELHRTGDPWVIATAIAAMEFDVQVRDARTGLPCFLDEERDAVRAGARCGPYAIEVRAADWADLSAVLAEIIDEQQAFDLELQMRSQRAQRAQRLVLLLLLAALAGVAAAYASADS